MLLSGDRVDKGLFSSGPGSSDAMIHTDHLGTPQKMTDGAGTVVWAADYKPFGEATTTINTITNNLRFPGQYSDAETGLHYNYFRDYNPAIGRYIESDPIGIKKGLNHLYAYVRNRPLNKKDRLGLQEFPGEPIPGTENINLDEEWDNYINAIADAAFLVTCEVECHLGLGKFHIPKCPEALKEVGIGVSCSELCHKALEVIREKREELKAERIRERMRQERGE